MSLQCKKCHSRNTMVVEAKKLAEATQNKSFMTASVGTASSDALLDIFNNLFKAIEKIFGFKEEKEKNQRNVILCKDCGYWEKI